METEPHRWIAALRHSHDRLKGLVRPLSPEQLRGPTYHSWTIAQALGHLGSQAEIYGLWLRAAVEGGAPPDMESLQGIWAAWDSRPPERQAHDSVEANEVLVRALEALADEELARMRLDLGWATLDAVTLPQFRLLEHAVHAWDIEVALDPSAVVSADAVDLLIDSLGWMAGRVGKPQGKAFRLQVRTAEPGRELGLLVGDEVRLDEGPLESADGEFSIPAEAFLRLVYGRLDPEHTPPVELTAPGVTLDDLRAVFPGV